jgi:hypothetical protein
VSYQDDLKRHLVDYKREHLGISRPGVFLYRGRKVPEEHILPTEDASRNLLEEAQSEASAFFAVNRTKRHQYFHHLNSSQAFAFNLLFPYFSGGPEASSSLLRALGQEGLLAKWEPEAIPEPKEESNIDVLWTTTDGAQTFCEVKLPEADFGKAADDARHRAKLARDYAPILAAHLAPERLERLAFFDAYQFNRNVWHMVCSDHNRLIFLLPRANTGLSALLEKLLLGVAPRTRDRISRVAIEDVIATLSRDERCPAGLREYANKLKQKYVI